MPYAILRFAKRKMGAVSAIEKHNERKKEAYKSNPDIDQRFTQDNYHLEERTVDSYRRELRRRIEAAGCRTRKDSVTMVETLITASPEFMRSLSHSEKREFFNSAYGFMKEKIGSENIVSAVVHMDEKTPHMHLCFCPITKDGRLSAKSILGNQAQLSKWQTDFHQCMSEKWPVLERGKSAMETGREHVPLWLYKSADRLDKEFERITAALSNINAFNAGKKRDTALELLSRWIPEAERFTAQVKKVDQYIHKLEQGYKEYERRYTNANSRLKEIAGDSEKELRKHQDEIYRLQQILQKQQRLLQKIPPSVLEQIKAGKRKER